MLDFLFKKYLILIIITFKIKYMINYCQHKKIILILVSFEENASKYFTFGLLTMLNFLFFILRMHEN